MRSPVTAILVLLLLFTACSGESQSELVGIRASIDPAVGDSRFLFGVNEIDGTRRGSPDEQVTVVARSLDAPDSVIEADADFLWIVQDSFGLYRVDLPWDRSGMWELDFSISTGEPTQPFLVLVQDEPATVAVGEPAPLVASPTIADSAIDDITTDYPIYEPFYELSLDEALRNGRKTVVVFATPAYCTSAACGPMMRMTKEIAADHPEVNWVHVEVYLGFNEADFAPDGAHLAPAVAAFGLPSEPWVFVMDEDGVVTSRIDGVLGDGELEAALAR